jgi:hypothetical protein
LPRSDPSIIIIIIIIMAVAGLWAVSAAVASSSIVGERARGNLIMMQLHTYKLYYTVP